MSSFLPISMRQAIREQNRKIQHSSRNGEGFLDHASNFIKDESQTKAEQDRRKEIQQVQRSSSVQISQKAREKQNTSQKTSTQITTSDSTSNSTIEELNFPPGSIYDEDGKITPPQTSEERSSFTKNI